MTVAYARTIHKFQGLTVGPVSEGKPKNIYDVVICDVDEKQQEGVALGLLYTAVSRGTTLGNDDGTNSAVYFQGTTFKPERIRNLTCKAGTNEEFKKAQQRRFWVNHIEKRRKESIPRVKTIINDQHVILEWAKNTTYSIDHLYHRIDTYVHRRPT